MAGEQTVLKIIQNKNGNKHSWQQKKTKQKQTRFSPAQWFCGRLTGRLWVLPRTAMLFSCSAFSVAIETFLLAGQDRTRILLLFKSLNENTWLCFVKILDVPFILWVTVMETQLRTVRSDSTEVPKGKWNSYVWLVDKKSANKVILKRPSFQRRCSSCCRDATGLSRHSEELLQPRGVAESGAAG